MGSGSITPNLNPSGCSDSCSIPEHHYLHILNEATNVTKVETGPQTYTLKENETVIFGPEKNVSIPAGHYCIVRNPVARGTENDLQYDDVGQVKLSMGNLEMRVGEHMFPLYPGEILQEEAKPLTILPRNSALKLKASRDFRQGEINRIAGDEWLFEGPGIYFPRPEVEVLKPVEASVIKTNEAIKLIALADIKDRDGINRVTGEEWIVKKPGVYLPGAYEEIVGEVKAHILTQTEAVHVKATYTFEDEIGKTRHNGDEWLVTNEDTEIYFPGVYEEVKPVAITTLNSLQYCVILDPVDKDGHIQLGRKKLVKGKKSFFLKPGERLEDGIKDVHNLSKKDGLVLTAKVAFKDTHVMPPVNRNPGERWIIRGPINYIPQIEVEVEPEKRTFITLKENEGIYVRNKATGKVRLVKGNYMLRYDEQLWKKTLRPEVEKLLNQVSEDKTSEEEEEEDLERAITFPVPSNACVQINDCKRKKSRVVFGPDIAMLEPDEEFTLLYLSGGIPKRPKMTQTLSLYLRQDNCIDVITAETADNVKLSLTLSYNWYFEVGNKSPEEAFKLFSVPDFIGQVCKKMSSRIRDDLAITGYEDFHKRPGNLIRNAVFGDDDDDEEEEDVYRFPENNLYVTSVDVLSIEPVDQRTRESLEKNAVLVLETDAKYRSKISKQKQDVAIEEQHLKEATELEKRREELLILKDENLSLDSFSQDDAVEVEKIKKRASAERAKYLAKAMEIEADAALEILNKFKESVLDYTTDINNQEVKKYKDLSDVDTEKLKSFINCFGQDKKFSLLESLLFEMVPISSANQKIQVNLLKGLNIHSAEFTTGNLALSLSHRPRRGLECEHDPTKEIHLENEENSG